MFGICILVGQFTAKEKLWREVRSYMLGNVDASPDLSGKRSSRHVALTSQCLVACYVMCTCHGNIAFEMMLLV